MKNIEMKAIFKGKVQGVFFRMHVQKYANMLGIKGYAKNKKDGSVEIIAVGNKRKLNLLLENIKKKPGFGYIDDVDVTFSKIRENFSSFQVL